MFISEYKEDELRQMSVVELKRLILAAGGKVNGCFEKEALVETAMKLKQIVPGAAQNNQTESSPLSNGTEPIKCYYEALGVSKTATPSEIRRAYCRLVIKFHPDKNRYDQQYAEEMFKRIGQAYHVLSDPNMRKQYDQFGFDGLNGNMIDPIELFRLVFGGDRFLDFFGDLAFYELFAREETQTDSSQNKRPTPEELERKQRIRVDKLCKQLIKLIEQYTPDNKKEFIEMEAKQHTSTFGFVHEISEKTHRMGETLSVVMTALKYQNRFDTIDENTRSSDIFLKESLKILFKVGRLDIDSTVREVCEQVMNKKKVESKERKLRGEAIKLIGQIFEKKGSESKSISPEDIFYLSTPPQSSSHTSTSTTTSTTSKKSTNFTNYQITVKFRIDIYLIDLIIYNQSLTGFTNCNSLNVISIQVIDGQIFGTVYTKTLKDNSNTVISGIIRAEFAPDYNTPKQKNFIVQTNDYRLLGFRSADNTNPLSNDSITSSLFPIVNGPEDCSSQAIAVFLSSPNIYTRSSSSKICLAQQIGSNSASSSMESFASWMMNNPVLRWLDIGGTYYTLYTVFPGGAQLMSILLTPWSYNSNTQMYNANSLQTVQRQTTFPGNEDIGFMVYDRQQNFLYISARGKVVQYSTTGFSVLNSYTLVKTSSMTAVASNFYLYTCTTDSNGAYIERINCVTNQHDVFNLTSDASLCLNMNFDTSYAQLFISIADKQSKLALATITNTGINPSVVKISDEQIQPSTLNSYSYSVGLDTDLHIVSVASSSGQIYSMSYNNLCPNQCSNHGQCDTGSHSIPINPPRRVLSIS
ncbi:hypothetical protein PPL_11655 [Heterostelium album PN500]|uniref:J domain-containing protein n=1 Tax=Heterostelium pallidum (strain ATCC 26659 / Pp 5 / PN500) TaxID=670386 RepID=D3BVC9_HETP5|nr:hypothetical protein PPL_11655 [Heterostelium album PN500]EFA74686.1 hypothetical protein PPL_11655 [Heterostelium album PN500]|eukprot:XP_020426820.1 hypothetical protein PPL_11655 [Heterostelium album PN500]